MEVDPRVAGDSADVPVDFPASAADNDEQTWAVRETADEDCRAVHNGRPYSNGQVLDSESKMTAVANEATG